MQFIRSLRKEWAAMPTSFFVVNDTKFYILITLIIWGRSSMAEAQECVSFLDYDRISDDLMYFDRDVYLRFNVQLARKGKDGNRYHYHNEYRYQSKYDNYGKVLTIRRHFEFYLSIDVRNEFESGIIIRAKDMMNIRLRLKFVAKWFSDGIFKIDKKKQLHIVGNPEPVIITNLGGKYIKFEPAIVDFGNGTKREGVRMTLNEVRFVDITVDTFMEFVYLINSINMYEAALSIVNYIPAEFGKYKEIVNGRDEDEFIDESQCDATIKKSRVINKVNKSFFDSMDEM